MARFPFVFELRLLLPDAGVECSVPRLDLVRGRGCEVGQGCETHRQDSFAAHGRATAIVRCLRAKISATGSGAAGCVAWAARAEAAESGPEGRAPGSPRSQVAILATAVCRRSRT